MNKSKYEFVQLLRNVSDLIIYFDILNKLLFVFIQFDCSVFINKTNQIKICTKIYFCSKKLPKPWEFASVQEHNWRSTDGHRT